MGAARPPQRRRQLLRIHAGPRRRDRRRGGRPPATPDPRTARRHPPVRPGAARDPATGQRLRQRRRANERHRLAQVRQAHRRGSRGRSRRHRPRAGLERRPAHRREHGRGDARWRRGDDPVPAADRRRARHRDRAGHGRQLEVFGDRGRAPAAPGQGRRELDLAQGGRRRVPAPGSPLPALRRRGRRHGLRRAGPGGVTRAARRGPATGLRPADERGRVPARGHHPRRQHLRHRDGDGGAQRLRRLLHRGRPAPEAGVPGHADVGRRLERVLRVPRQRPRARGDPLGLPLPRDRRGPRHGHRECRRPADLRRDRAGAARAGRGRRPEPPAGLDRAAARAGRALRRRERHGAGRRGPRLAGEAGGGAPDPCAGRRHRRVHRRRHRGGSPRRGSAARRHRGPADGRDERRRRPVRRRPDVPAPGRQERPGHEEGRRRAHPVSRGGARGDGQALRDDRHGHGQGRRPRHRQEHRRRGPRLQRLRGRRSGRHGPGRADPGEGDRDRRGPDRPVRADHPVARRDDPRRRGDGAPGVHDPAAHRRGDDVAHPHGDEDRARLLGAGGPRAGRVAGGRRGGLARAGRSA